MARIRGKDTTIERVMSELLSVGGLVFDKHVRDLPGTPDFAFRAERLAVFVDGDFWHGWRFPVWEHRMSEKWRQKISETRRRDRSAHSRLRRMGWMVIRIWEHQIEAGRLSCVMRIVRSLNNNEIDTQRIAEFEKTLPPLRRRNRLPRAKPTNAD